MPYVYLLTHKISGQFYIGYREANKLPSNEDLPLYQSSSIEVHKLGFNNFEFLIIAEFFNGQDAYHYENVLIKEHFHNPLCLNKQYIENGKYRTVGPISKEHRLKISNANKNRKKPPRSAEHCFKLSLSKKGRKTGPRSIETREKISQSKKGNLISDEHRAKLITARKRVKLSPETYIKIGNALRGREMSEEHKEQRSKALKGHEVSKATRDKISISLTGRKCSTETILKRTAALKNKNGMSKRCSYDGKEYPCIAEACRRLNLKRYVLIDDPLFALIK